MGALSRWKTPATVLFLRPKCFSLQDPNSSLSNRINASVSQSVHSAGRFRTVRSLVTSFFFPLLSFSFECGLWSLVPSAFLLDLTPTYILAAAIPSRIQAPSAHLYEGDLRWREQRICYEAALLVKLVAYPVIRSYRYERVSLV